MSLKYQYEEDEMPPEEDSTLGIAVPTPVYTYILLAAIILVAVTQFVTGLDDSIERAGFAKQDFLHGQYWRILTGATVHGSIIHVLMNSYALFNVGRIFEMLANRAHLAIVFLLSAVAGGLLSLVFLPDGTSVGASGGIVGLIGYLAIYSFRRKQFISSSFRNSLLFNIGFLFVFGLVLWRVVDNYGHLGGLITGGVYGLLQIPSDPTVDPREARGPVEIAGLVALGVYIAACIFSVVLITRVI
jgi:membrane associated rhomboid family serine protease